jgi:hypothetical protein
MVVFGADGSHEVRYLRRTRRVDRRAGCGSEGDT